ncbi:winged helix-turn-helix transcriptional regulator [Gellertiella hungarica]|uniref:DNA-binding HxlR family transcriptional regulator n=1 Tax=Gellertiella hungarica TaxID=1572859 RepID=A0A7W6J1I0_9HYPH|nr:helix-turn-helix domain-containing protein [Gellertiella hungarica]MBB4063061.1 DNA-binding HxlR family transcriptional regulator [Gellertiella hungarica]
MNQKLECANTLRKAFPDADGPVDPALEKLVEDIIGKVADKWTMLILEALEEHGTLRFTEVGRLVPGISQKMLTKTLRQMEYDGLVERRIHPVIPPHVDYTLTEMGHGLSYAFCGVWTWAEENRARIEAARTAFLARNGGL